MRFSPRGFSFALLAVLSTTTGRCSEGTAAAETNTATAFYPIGIYAVNSTNDYPLVKQAGFNVITAPATKECLDAAERVGLKVLASPGTSAGAGFDAAAAAKAVAEFDSHPALWAWYLVDEPDLNEVPPEQIVRAKSELKIFGAHKPTALVLQQGYEAFDYANITDILMVDRYPIPWLPLANFGQHVEMTRLALGREKPLIAVIQAFDWGAIPEMLPGEKNLRAPTYDEMRCMTYEALARGANGIFYFAYDAGWKMRDHPETWTALQKVIAEVNRRLPLFQARLQWWPKAHEYRNPAHRFSGALESSITARLLRVSSGNKEVPDGDYIVAVNNTTNTVEYSFAIPPSSQATENIKLLNETRTVPVENRRVNDSFETYAVHIYGPLP